MRTLAEIDAELEAKRKELSSVRGTKTEIYTRIVGYYRSLDAWNKGKREEYRHRNVFDTPEARAESVAVEHRENRRKSFIPELAGFKGVAQFKEIDTSGTNAR